MDKRMYSLILKDDLVKAVDKLAYENSTSRSGLINQILAQHLSILTPEMRIAEIFDHAARVAGSRGELQIQQQPSGSMLVLKSVIHYKYNPAIRYSVEIAVIGNTYSGEFKVTSRSQSDALLSRLTVYFELWSQIEQTCLSEKLPGNRLKYSIAGGRFRRTLVVEQAGHICDSQQLGEAIGLYVGLFDEAMNLYFSANLGVDMETFAAMLALYRKYLAETPAIM